MHCVVRLTVTFLIAFAPHAANATPLISEAFYDAVGSDNGLSFVEFYGEPGSSLDGLFLEGINGANGSPGPTIALSGLFPAASAADPWRNGHREGRISEPEIGVAGVRNVDGAADQKSLAGRVRVLCGGG